MWEMWDDEQCEVVALGGEVYGEGGAAEGVDIRWWRVDEVAQI